MKEESQHRDRTIGGEDGVWFQSVWRAAALCLLALLPGLNNGPQALAQDNGAGEDAYVRSLLHMDGYHFSTDFIDQAGRTWSAHGNARISQDKKRYGQASGYFDGNGDYVQTPDTDDFDPGGDAFTVDFWIYPESLGGEATSQQLYLVGKSNPGSNVGYDIRLAGGKIYVTGVNGWAANIQTSVCISLYTWQHIALSVTADTAYLFVNGVLRGNCVRSGIADTSEPFSIGWTPGFAGVGFKGFMDDFRFSRGIARWTSDFLTPYATPSVVTQPKSAVAVLGQTVSLRVVTSGDLPMQFQWFKDGVPMADGGRVSGALSSTLTITAVAGDDGGDYSVTASNAKGSVTSRIARLTVDLTVRSLLHMEGPQFSTSFVDDVGRTWSAYGDAKIRQDNRRYGWASGYFDGNGDYVQTPDTDDFDPGGDAFTVDFWIYPESLGGESTSQQLYLVGKSNPGSNVGYDIRLAGGKIYVTGVNGWAANIQTSVCISLYTWQHIALSVTADTAYLFVNGVLRGNCVRSSIADTSEPFSIGWTPGFAGVGFKGYMDEFRYSRGIARWTSSFVDPYALPSIVTQPQDLAVSPHESAQFTVVTSDVWPRQYQWLKNGIALADSERVSGALSAVLRINDVVTGDQGEYSAVITHPLGVLVSDSATLTVIAPDIALEQPEGTDLSDGGDKSFGAVSIGSSASLTFVIKNSGSADLTQLAVTKEGAQSFEFTVDTTAMSPVLVPMASTTFEVIFNPAASGLRTTMLHISSNDPDENPFHIVLAGTGIVVNSPPVVASPIPDQSGRYGMPLTFTFATDTFIDPDPGQSLRYTASGMPPGVVFDELSHTFIGTPTTLGTFSITVVATDDGTPPYSASDVFELTVGPAPLTIAATGKSKAYGDAVVFDETTPSLDFTVVGLASGDTVSSVNLTSAGTSVGASVGEYDIVPSEAVGVGLGNYEITYVKGALAVNPAVATVVANAKSKTYGQANPVLDAVVTGEVAGGDPVQYSLSTEATELSGVGSYGIAVTLGKNPNYRVTATDGTLTVNPAVATVVANAKSKTYGQANPVLDAVVMGEVVGGDPVQYSLSTTATQLSGVGLYPITVTLGQNSNYVVNGTYSVLTITPAALEVRIHSPKSGLLQAVNTPIEFAGSFTPTGYEGRYSAYWTFCSTATGETTIDSDVDGLNVSANVQFPTPGVYVIRLTVEDAAGTLGVAELVEGDLLAYVVIYDPNGGFVTGGGWINSPAGAFHPDLREFAGVTGKATFGFVAKYLKGAKVPTGNTEFHFKAGNLNFKSTAYQWLVVAGARAQYKGWGTINDGGEYAFILTAIDGALLGGEWADRFRIKIWDENSGTVIYDNQAGAADTAALATDGTLLGGGNIVIHRP